MIEDYYSRFLGVIEMKELTLTAVIALLKNIFTRYGIPETVRSDGGKQFDFQLLENFSKRYGFKLVLSSQTYAQSYGETDRAIKTAKQILTKSEDPNLDLLTLRKQQSYTYRIWIFSRGNFVKKK